MVNKLHKDNKGFTIIEVLIVLAIAGLIMLIVFLAVPALQRNQRNNARNSEASRMSSAVTECLANRNGLAASCTGAANLANLGLTVVAGPPATLQGFQQFTDVTFADLGDDGHSGDLDTINIDFGVRCRADGAAVDTTGASARDFTVTWTNESDIDRCIGSESN
jgi:prepilin-type N-terminal cleavage/methylation domain-containing protein